ncbi:BirA family biotin operon repressor/biotin-[acetyl-CoA-carboxylase] ligase [Microbacteriaceae bacterium SG_E_30_P1]|uniref:biotin--[biotin carboxyl-carrier protein] ligase n=1 Tax=Antiquaquibacter oligotrophicus TaxID=2880260 RepID=A0ABT6KP14_9MICO|nr:biotin--[acetyl-CoA-carboxylase] ligase [Antiquaquibacter oligotrophicus]MDH6181738.1 BirA family biotin operon repressor/biotin-[acetyl-CoA-carboxylase] ligase [Antiquaquibacter oligotrophicus]UDF12581.1 biotin--[acetyl-CoA-carboxylase] ligase [Antiquaquibacter oligotrophicus]
MHVEWVTSTESTNADLVRRASERPLAPLEALATTDQTAGRGRQGRSWTAPEGTALAISLFVPHVSSWLPLLTGLAMTRAVQRLVPAPATVSLKWPNDVLIAERKVSGILGEVVPGGAVMGAGLNLSMSEAQLPVPTATSLALEGAAGVTAETAAQGYLAEFEALWQVFSASGYNAAHGLRDAVSSACGTLGRRVRVELPDDAVLVGVAASLDADGRLVVERDGQKITVAAGDVTHVRTT